MKSIDQIAKEFEEYNEKAFSKQLRAQRARGAKNNRATRGFQKLLKDSLKEPKIESKEGEL